MHSAALAGEAGALCALDEGMALLRLIDAIERSVVLGNWISQEDVR
jgi:hypothetical protein